MNVREYLVNEVKTSLLENEENGIMTTQAILVMHDAGLLDITYDEKDKPLFALKTDVEEEKVSAAQTAFYALMESDDEARDAYLKGESSTK